MIYVKATIELVEGKREQFLKEQLSLLPLVRAEAGCLEYVPTIDLATSIAAQFPLRPNVVVMHEKWESLEALKAHLVAPHMAEFRARVKPLVVGSKLSVTTPTER